MVTATNTKKQLITNKDEIVENCEMIKQVLTDTSALDKEAEEMQSEILVVSELTRQYVNQNAREGIDQAKYQQCYNGIAARYEKAKTRIEGIEELRQVRRVKRKQLEYFIDTLSKQATVLTESDEELWISTIDKVTVYAGDDIRFTFRDGQSTRVR